MSLASDGRGEGALARLPRAYLFYIGALLRYNRVPSLPKVYSPRQILSARRSRRKNTLAQSLSVCGFARGEK